MSIRNMSLEQLQEAVRIRLVIEQLETRLAQLEAGNGQATETKGRRGRMWAAAKARVESKDKDKPRKRTRRISAAGRAAIAEAARKRWAKARTQKS